MNNRRNSYSSDLSNPDGSSNHHWKSLSDDELKDNLKKFKYAYLEALNKLIRFDKQRIFRFPVDTSVVTDYTTYIKNPMDFETMLHKLEDDCYRDDIKPFDDDIALIVNNCKTYNSSDTIFYDAALKVEEFYSKLRPILEKKISTIIHLMNRKIHSISKVRQKAPPIGSMSPSESSVVSQPIHDSTKHLPTKQEQTLTHLPYMDSTDTQMAKNEQSDSSLNVIKKKRRKSDQIKMGGTGIIPPEIMNPATNTIQIALSVSGLTNETFGKLMANFNGLPRLLNSLDVAQNQLLMNQQSRAIWGPKSIKRLRRIINNFEWKRSFDFPIATRKNTLYRKIQLLMAKYRRDTYKSSVENFIGSNNLSHVNEAFPNLSNTLKDLCIPHQMLSSNTELKY